MTYAKTAVIIGLAFAAYMLVGAIWIGVNLNHGFSGINIVG